MVRNIIKLKMLLLALLMVRSKRLHLRSKILHYKLKQRPTLCKNCQYIKLLTLDSVFDKYSSCGVAMFPFAMVKPAKFATALIHTSVWLPPQSNVS